MQNAELLKARDELESALTICTNLYDFAPVGHFTLGRDGVILRVNLIGASLLGSERSRLIGRRFGLFVADENRPFFSEFLGKVFASLDKKACEVALTKKVKCPLHLQIEVVACSSAEECHVAVIDVTGHRRAEDALKKNSWSLQRSTILWKCASPGMWTNCTGRTSF